MLKIYPCMVMPGTELEKDYKEGKFKPIETEEAVKIIAEFLSKVPEYVRIMRIQRDIPTKVTIDGVGLTNFRQVVHQLMEKNGTNVSQEPSIAHKVNIKKPRYACPYYQFAFDSKTKALRERGGNQCGLEKDFQQLCCMEVPNMNKCERYNGNGSEVRVDNGAYVHAIEFKFDGAIKGQFDPVKLPEWKEYVMHPNTPRP